MDTEAAREMIARNYRPKPKEEVMDCVKTTCAGCGETLLNLEACVRCADRTAERRALYREAYMAALSGGLMACGVGESWPSIEAPVNYCRKIALETVRQWDAMMAELEGE